MVENQATAKAKGGGLAFVVVRNAEMFLPCVKPLWRGSRHIEPAWESVEKTELTDKHCIFWDWWEKHNGGSTDTVTRRIYWASYSDPLKKKPTKKTHCISCAHWFARGKANPPPSLSLGSWSIWVAVVVPLEDGGSRLHHVSTCVALKTDSERSVPCLQTSASEDAGFSSPHPEEPNKSLQNFNWISKR